jgi:hypothetical protein
MQGGRISISVDGNPVGGAARARLDASGGKLALGGLDPLATLFFAAWVGPSGSGGRDPWLGRVSVSDEQSRPIFDAASVAVFSFSSGTGEVVLTAPRSAAGGRR